MSTDPPLPPGPPLFAAPTPRDPKSIDVWPTFKAGTVAWTRVVLTQFLLFGGLFGTAFALLALTSPTMTAAMFGIQPESFDPAELYGLGGVFLLSISFGGLFSVAAYIQDDAVLDGRPRPPVGSALSDAIGRIPAALGAYLLVLGVIMIPYLLVIGCIVGILALSGGLTAASGATGPSAAVGIFAFLGVLVLVPVVVYAAIVLQFGYVLASTRDAGPVTAVRESFRLVRGRFWRVFGYTVLIGVAVQAFTYAGLGMGLLVLTTLPVAAAAVYGLAIAGAIPFQLVQQVALVRRLEAVRSGAEATGAPDEFDDDEPAPEPAPEWTRDPP